MNNLVDSRHGVDAPAFQFAAPKILEEKDEAGISCFENAVPDFAGREMERLYGELLSSLPYLEVHKRLQHDTSTYIARDGEDISAIFLFRREKNAVKVLNSGMKLDAQSLVAFCNFIFEKYPSLKRISIDSVEIDIDRFPFPLQRLDCPSDILMDLPATQEAYLASLNGKTRNNIKRAIARLSSELPGFDIAFHRGEDVDENQFHRLLNLNKARMERVNRVYGRKSDDVGKILALSRARGLVSIATMDGVVCGGSIGYRVGNTFVGHIVSHDPAYDRYSLGLLSIYWTICECIGRGCKRFNFMSGNNPYKTLLGGKPRRLQSLLIYRSPLHAALSPVAAGKMAIARRMQSARLRVQARLSALRKLQADGKLDGRSRMLFQFLERLRAFKDRASVYLKRH
jgi:CelD/BcsL family acetyltransferase involved in cellulose biosynthesis